MKTEPACHPSDPDRMPCEVGPLEAFSDELAPDGLANVEPPKEQKSIISRGIGADSANVHSVFDSRCCGWLEPPTPGELYDAVRTAEPTERQKQIVWVWLDEAPVAAWIGAWRDRVYSWRMLARAAKLCGNKSYNKLRVLNTFTIHPELVPEEWLPWIETRREISGRGRRLQPKEPEMNPE